MSKISDIVDGLSGHDATRLKEFGGLVQDLRTSILFEDSKSEYGECFAQQHFLAALASLEQAHRQFKLAHLFAIREQDGRDMVYASYGHAKK